MTNEQAIKEIKWVAQYGYKPSKEYIGYDALNDAFLTAIRALEEQSKIVHCKECKYSHMTMSGDCKYCDIHSRDNPVYFPGDYFCADGEV